MIICSNTDTSKSTFTNNSIEGIADAPQKVGGSGEFFTPFEFLEASLASCVGITLRMYSKAHEIPAGNISVVVEIDDSDHNNIVATKKITFDGDLTEEQKAKLMKVAESCKVGKVLSKGMSIQVVE